MTTTAPTPSELAVLETSAEWTAPEVADPDTWTRHLSDDDVDELRTALARARSVTHEVLDVTRGDFPLPGATRSEERLSASTPTDPLP